MPKVNVKKTCNLSAQDCFQKIKDFLPNDPDLKKLDSSYECHFHDSTLSGKAKGSKFEAEMKVHGDAPSTCVEFEISLPFILTPIKGVVEATLKKKLDKLLG